jgi:hypothetical protein
MNPKSAISKVPLLAMAFIATAINAQTTNTPEAPRPAVFVHPSEADHLPTVNTTVESLNPMACAFLPSSLTSVLSEQLPRIGQPPEPAVTVTPSEAAAPVAAVQPNGSAGYCTNAIMGPTEYYAGTWYYSPPIPPVGSVPSNAVIYQVSWTYSLSRTPAGQRVWLCDSVDCFEITGLPHGTTHHFDGHSANTNFAFDFYVTGSGQLSPWVTTSSLQVCSAFSY